MSDVEQLPCPECGELAETSGGPAAAVRDFSTGRVSARSTERRDCPGCGNLLERDVLPGAPWRLASP